MRMLIAGWLSRLRVVGRRQPRQVAIAAVAALCIIAVAGTVLAFTLRPGPTAMVERSFRAAATSTLTATAVPTTAPTATNTPHPVATSVPHTPPPPPVPTPPPATPTATPCPTATPTQTPTATATSQPTATATATPTSTSGTTGAAPAASAFAPLARRASMLVSCAPCPSYSGNNPSQPAIQAALFAAADAYHLPRNLLQAVAWQESKWHENVMSCDGGIGLMQIQNYNFTWLNQEAVPECGLATTNNDPYTLQGNANLGAKYLSYLMCFYSYWGGHAATPPYSLSNPAPYTIDWYYTICTASVDPVSCNHPALPYPDTTRTDGQPSLCAGVFNDPSHPEYPDLPSSTAQPWSCPYSAKAGDTTLLDITLSAYNEGPGYTDSCGICNPGYVASVEGFIPQFFSGGLPVPS